MTARELRKSGLLVGLWLAGTALSAAQVQAQGDSAAPAASESQAPDIVVTALRRAVNLQDTPAAVTAFTAEAITNAGIQKPADFINLTSSVNLVETQNAGNAFVVIRGISQARNSEPSVAVVVDGVQQVNPAQFSQELFDVQQIEVLKGPQGGLYGRNAIGGAIIVSTKQPTDRLEGRFTAGIDNGFGFKFVGGLSGPIGEGVKFRLAASYVNTDGYIENTYLNEKADPYKDFALRGNLLFDASDRLTVDIRGSLALLRTQGFYYNIVPDNDVNNTSLPVRVNNPGIDNRDMYNATLKLTYNGDGFTATSITAYDTVSEIITGDAYNFLPITESALYQWYGSDQNQSQFLDVKAWSQELRLESAKSSKLFWMVGGYMIGTDRFISTGNMFDLGKGVFPVYHQPSTNPNNPQYTFLADQQDNFAWALFANVGYPVTDQIRVDASLRYDRDRRKNTTMTPTAYLPNVPGYPQGATGDVRRKTFDSLQPKVTLTYKPISNVTLYTSYSQGFRSGGFNQTGVGAVAASSGIVGVGDIFQAEEAETFEVGIKTRTSDHLLTFNAAAYTTLDKNSYFFVFLYQNSTQNLGNVPRGRVKGLEFEATLNPTRDLAINAALGYTWSEITAFPDASQIGHELPMTSRSTLNVGMQYTPQVGAGLNGLFRVDYRRTGRTWWDVQNSTVRNPVTLVDARIGVSGDHWNVAAYAKNLFNEIYNAEFSPGGFVFKAKPRVYGLEASYKF